MRTGIGRLPISGPSSSGALASLLSAHAEAASASPMPGRRLLRAWVNSVAGSGPALPVPRISIARSDSRAHDLNVQEVVSRNFYISRNVVA